MDQRLTVLTLGVDNLSLQRDFYESKLGWLPVAANPDIVFYQLNGLLFSMCSRPMLASGAGVPAAGSGFRSFSLSYNVSAKDSVDVLYKDFTAKSVSILQAPAATPFGGYYFTFSDAEHNVWEIAYNPYIPLNSAGDPTTHHNIDNL